MNGKESLSKRNSVSRNPKDFIKLNMENLKAGSKLSLNKNTIISKRTRPASSKGKTSECNNPGPLTTCTTNRENKYMQGDQLANCNIFKDAACQHCNTEDDCFLRDAKIIEPSKPILLEIFKNSSVKAPEVITQKKQLNEHSAKREVHLENWAEFLERGSISRRRKILEKKKVDVQKKVEQHSKINQGCSFPKTSFVKRKTVALENKKQIDKVEAEKTNEYIAQESPSPKLVIVFEPK